MNNEAEARNKSDEVVPLVSISCITFNHERYIAQAIDGFIMQKTTFPIEILIHDDASTDNTANIIKGYEAEYPEIIKPIYEAENQWTKGKRGSAVFNFPRARGKYIALCEGDDYWTDPYKLQKQVDFLENNPEFSGVAHQSWVQYEDKRLSPHFFRNNVKSILNLNDFLTGRMFHTASFIYKAKITSDNKMPINITSGDRALFLLCAVNGPIRYFNEPMCIYRKSITGISSWITYDLLVEDLNIIPWMQSIFPGFPKLKYLAFIHRTIVTYPKEVPVCVKIKHWSLYIIYSFSYFPKNMLEILRIVIPQNIRDFLSIPWHRNRCQ